MSSPAGAKGHGSADFCGTDSKGCSSDFKKDEKSKMTVLESNEENIVFFCHHLF
jgi:hypothetical protein